MTSEATTQKGMQLQAQLAQNGAPPTVQGFDTQMKSWFAENNKRLSSLWGSEEDAKRFIVIAANVVAKNPFLLKATFPSFVRCLLTSSETKLYPGPLQECAYVPMKNGKTGQYEAQFWPMYKGLVKLAYNSGMVKSIECNVVYEGDEFDFELGTNKFLRYKPFLGSEKERGDRKCAYCIIQTRFGDSQIVVLPIQFFWAIKSRSPAARGGDSPWNSPHASDVDAQIKKTILKQALKLIPQSTDLAELPDEEADEPSQRPADNFNMDFSQAGASSVAVEVVEPGEDAAVEGKK